MINEKDARAFESRIEKIIEEANFIIKHNVPECGDNEIPDYNYEIRKNSLHVNYTKDGTKYNIDIEIK